MFAMAGPAFALIAAAMQGADVYISIIATDFRLLSSERSGRASLPAEEPLFLETA